MFSQPDEAPTGSGQTFFLQDAATNKQTLHHQLQDNRSTQFIKSCHHCIVAGMTVDEWLDRVSEEPQDMCAHFPPTPQFKWGKSLTSPWCLSRSSAPSLDSYDEGDKENCRPVYPFTRSHKRKRDAISTVKAMGGDEETPRPSKKQQRTQGLPTVPKPFLPRPQSAGSGTSASTAETNTTLESHQSGRASPTKQMAILQDAEEPVLFYDLGMDGIDMAEDVEALRDGVQTLADHRGILGHTVSHTVFYCRGQECASAG